MRKVDNKKIRKFNICTVYFSYGGYGQRQEHGERKVSSQRWGHGERWRQSEIAGGTVERQAHGQQWEGHGQTWSEGHNQQSEAEIDRTVRDGEA